MTQNREASLSAAAMQRLRSQMRGEMILPSDERYEQARRVYNGMIDRRPAVIACCQGVADVVAAIRFARANQIPLAIRGGGHSGPGLGTCNGGLVIDLSLMKGIQIEANTRTARIDGGCTWGEVDRATHPFGLATPSGFISSTGVGGLTLGGGIGYLTRAYGLTVDSLLEVELVLADGSVVSASADRNPDLFWAVRGGGGNFGVVTSFTFRLHPVDQVYGGPILWPLELASELLPFWRDFIRTAPEDINGWFAFLTVPPVPAFPEALHRKKMCAIVWCYTGPLDQATERFAPIRAFGPPSLDHAGPLPYPALQSVFDGLYPPGLQWYWKADFFRDLPDETIALHLAYAAQLPTGHSTMHLYPVNGAAHRLATTDTAFSFRDAEFAEVIVGVDPDPANNERMIAWAREYWQALHPHSAGGAYVNMIMDEGHEQIQAAYRDNYPRLARIKATYDPENLFRLNQNIRPTL